MLTEQNEERGQSLFRGNIAAVKHKHWNRGVCSTKIAA